MKKILLLSIFVFLTALFCIWEDKEFINSQKAAVQEASQVEEPTEETGELLSENGYCYTQLSTKERALYVSILRALQENDVDVAVTAKEETFEKVFQCVMNDHPEIFYVDGYTFIRYKEGEQLAGQSFSGSYTCNREEIIQKTRQIEEKAEEIISGLPAGSDEYEKVRYVYEYLVMNTEYVLESADNQNICSVFLNGKSVCQGYAKAAQYLLNKMGIEALLVSGTVEEGEDHAWNIVRIEDEYYHVDITWGDASYVMQGDGGGYDGKLPQINYEYLCVADEQLMRTHTVNAVVPVPACNSMAANYYVREGAYFETADLKKVKALFEREIERQSRYVTLKCADAEVYAEMESSLIMQQKVFHYLPKGNGTVAYTLNEEQLALSFWLQD